jgi:hypothetical protein
MSTSEISKGPASSGKGGGEGRETIPRVVQLCNPLPEVLEEAIDTAIENQNEKVVDEVVAEVAEVEDDGEEEDKIANFESTTTCYGDSCKRLYQSLKSISVTTREYLTGQLTQSEAFSRVKQKYASFKSMKTSEGLFSIKNKFKQGSFMFLIYLFSWVFSLWVCYQIVKSLLGKSHDIRVIFALIYLVILNPVYSVLTVMLQMRGTYENLASDMTIDSIRTIENALYPCTISIESFTRDNVCNFHKHFDTDNICNSSNGDHDNDGNEDTDLKRRIILESLSNFFDNQRKFMLKSNNTSIGIKSNTSLDQCLAFLLGNNVEQTLSENVSKNQNTILFNTSSYIRTNISSVLQQIEGEAYNRNPVESYHKDFIEYLNRDLINFVQEVIELVRFDQKKYYDSNNMIRSKPHLDHLLSTTLIATTGMSGNARIDLVAGLFLKIQQVLRRLNKALLPEYSSLRKLLYGDLDVDSQRNLYEITEVEQLYPFMNTLVGLVFNNPSFLTEVSESGESSYTKTQVNVETFYLADQPSYETQPSLLFRKTIALIASLSKQKLPNDYTVRYSSELQLIKACIISFVYDVSRNHVRVIEYFANQIMKNGQSETSYLFLDNVSKIIQYSYYQHSKVLESLNVLQDGDGTESSFNLSKYISFEEFKVKLDNFDQDGMRAYSATVKKASDNIKTLKDKLGQSELKQIEINFSKSYSDLTSLYGILSFLILLNVIHRVFYGTDISFSFVKAERVVQTNTNTTK